MDAVWVISAPLAASSPLCGDVLASKNGLGNIDTCGSGTDTVNADTNDQVAADCEHVTKS